ncbi:MAG: TetR/AcrR family transcriptional regulator [Acidobacteriota bacterium]|nr:TetR/AcrR family transcriptional regulator [Acidobacteriota bacterium]
MATLTKYATEDLTPRGRGRPRDEVARSRILDAALEILEETTFDNATTDAIAERAGASKATIYRWWPNKAAVVIEALRDVVAQELPFPDTGNLREDVRIQLQNFVKLLNGRRGRAFRAFIAAAQGDKDVAAAFRSIWIRTRREQTKAVLLRHQEEGRLRRGTDLDSILDLLYGPFYFRLLAGHGPLTPAFADTIAELALAGIATNHT